MGAFGGLENFVLIIAQGVAKLPGFSVEVVFKRAGDFSLHPDLAHIIAEAGVNISFCPRASLSLWRSVCRADLVHVQNPCPAVVLMARLADKPLLINVISTTPSLSEAYTCAFGEPAFTWLTGASISLILFVVLGSRHQHHDMVAGWFIPSVNCPPSLRCPWSSVPVLSS